ncbi:MAG: hypothetical protein DRJ03_03370 [Chloroflexi bacterium]|nr:MAG: hypothetical protein DRJ03_03370 [Chloroflexota bacterium]
METLENSIHETPQTVISFYQIPPPTEDYHTAQDHFADADIVDVPTMVASFLPKLMDQYYCSDTLSEDLDDLIGLYIDRSELYNETGAYIGHLLIEALNVDNILYNPDLWDNVAFTNWLYDNTSFKIVETPGGFVIFRNPDTYKNMNKWEV